MLTGYLPVRAVAASLLLVALVSVNGQNAAPRYLEAFKYQQRLNAEFPDETVRREVWMKVVRERDFDADARRFLEVTDPFLDLAVAGSASPDCRWDKDFFDGYVGMLAECRSVATLLTARMELRARDEATDAALNDFMAIIRMSENFEGEHHAITGFLIKNAMQSTAIQRLAGVLPLENRAAMNRLSEFWSRHRSELKWDLGERMRQDARLGLGEIRRWLAAGTDLSTIKDWMFERGGLNSRAPFIADIEDADGMLAALSQFEDYNTRAAAVCEHRDIEPFTQARLQFENAFSGQPVERAWWFTADGLDVYYFKAKKVEIVTAMLDLALQRAVSGDEALMRITDPATGRPFATRLEGPGYVIKTESAEPQAKCQLSVGSVF